MYCRNCGAQIPEGNRFCENCGTPVPDLMQSGSAEDAKAGTGLILHHGMRKRTIILIAVIAALVIGGIAGGIAAAVSSHHASGTYQDKIDEGNQYLDSEQYDDALSAFDDAIAIEPKKPDGYIGKANVQSRQGKHQDAIETLTGGKKNVTICSRRKPGRMKANGRPLTVRCCRTMNSISAPTRTWNTAAWMIPRRCAI